MLFAAIVGYCDLSSPDAEEIFKRQTESTTSHDDYLTVGL